jgi:molybdate transport system substrate-binding protein
MESLRLLSGGAAQALVEALAPAFREATGLRVEGTFGAVGAMREKLLAGEPCDLVILTQALVEDLARQGPVLADGITPLGTVKTGLAVKAGAQRPEVASADDLRRVLAGASAIYFPDPQKATAGIHFMKVLKTLGLDTLPSHRFRTYPNGATAMREMAAAATPDAIGCTQVTEILYTPGVTFAGLLPPEFELATVYTAGVCSHAPKAEAAALLARVLAAPEAAALRAQCGFEALMPAAR